MRKPIKSSQDITLDDVAIKVEYTIYPPHRGARDSFMGKAGAGAQLEPDEPAHIEIDNIIVDMAKLEERIEEIEKLIEEDNDE